MARPLTPAEREDIEERAAIMEFDGRLPRAEAERLAISLTLRRRDTPLFSGTDPVPTPGAIGSSDASPLRVRRTQNDASDGDRDWVTAGRLRELADAPINRAVDVASLETPIVAPAASPRLGASALTNQTPCFVQVRHDG